MLCELFSISAKKVSLLSYLTLLLENSAERTLTDIDEMIGWVHPSLYHSTTHY